MRKITRTADSYDLVYERRRLERFDLQVPAKIEVLTSPDPASILELLTKDICAGGAYFPTKTALASGTKVKPAILEHILAKKDVTLLAKNLQDWLK